MRVYGPRRGRISTEIILPHSYNPINNRDDHTGGREPPDAMSHCYADTSLPDLLGRPSHHYAEMSMQKLNTIKCARLMQEVF